MSLPSLAQPDFLARLRALLASDQGGGRLRRLCLELDAHGLIAYPLELAELCGAMARDGVYVGVRRLDQEPMALAQLHTLALRYVKLGGDFCEQSLHSPGGLRLLQAMTQTAAALGVQVWVTDVVSAETVRMLQANDVLTLAA